MAAENKQYNEVVNGKLKEIEPLQKSLGKFRSENNAMRAQGAGLCSSIEELDQLVSLKVGMPHSTTFAVFDFVCLIFCFTTL